MINGQSYPQWVGEYIAFNFSSRGIKVYKEIFMGKSIIGKKRRVDLLVVNEIQNKAIAIECKYQSVSGTADEKVPYTLEDARAMQMDCYVVYGGDGFSAGIVHMLEASELACFAEPKNENLQDFFQYENTKEIDQLLAMKFSWWDVFTENKTPI
jgi:hypothetical protein